MIKLTDSLELFFHPRGVAVIGASSNPAKLSYGVLHNLVTHGYRGPVYPVNPKGGAMLDCGSTSRCGKCPTR
ncbi:MAG: CoA-binding protein [Anaerolineae bacterium]